MDDLIDEILAEMPDPFEQQFIDLDIQAPPPVLLPADETWVEILNGAKAEFEVDGAIAVFSTWKVEIDLGGDGTMTDERAARLLQEIPQGEYILKLKYLREHDGDWVIEDKFDPVKAERRQGQGIVKINQTTTPGVLTGSDKPYYQNAYPITAVVYGLYPLRDPDPANLAPMRDGDLNCVAQ